MHHYLLIAATEAATEEHSNPLVPESAELIWGAVSFVLLFILLSKFAFPKMRTVLAERTSSIEGELERAEQERSQAQALLRQYEQQLKDAHAESVRILDQARTNAERLEAELRAKAEDEAARIVERARAAVAVERDRAIGELRGEVGALAVDLASKVVGESLDRDRHMRLVDQYVSNLQSQGSN